jgi:hypothetical protein
MQCSGNPFIEPIKSYVRQYLSQTTNPKEFIKYVNAYLLQKEAIKEGLIMRKYDPKRIQANLERNVINLSNGLSNQLWETYFERRGEVWTEGVGTKKGGERSGRERSGTKRSGSKTRKTKNKQKYSRKRY